MAIFETLFDVVYLISVVVLGIIMICKANGNKQYIMFGFMAIILGCGDAFHLVPRVMSLWTENGFVVNAELLGTGQFITSITMTIFYLVLYHIWRVRYEINGQNNITIAMYVLSAIRIALCFFPQNMWTSLETSLSWGIYRNIPFAIMGIIIIWIFYKEAKSHNDKAFGNMWLAITLSFGFYAPVVLLSGIFPPVGALMMPKTLAYVWVVWMGYKELMDTNK